jgi:Holliday junction resolvase
MAHSSKRKGNRFEREVVKAAEDAGLEADRAYASNGQSLGEVEECDVLVEGGEAPLRVQAKRRKSHAQYLHPPEGTDAVVLREDREEALAIVPLEMLLQLLRDG